MRLSTVAAMAVLLAACSSAPPVPETPAFKTKQGKACAEQCESEHSKCENTCKMIRGPTGGPARQRSNCISACIRKTQDCYADCESGVPAVAPKQ